MKMNPATLLKVLLVAVVVAALGSVAAVLWIGASVQEEAVADASHEHGLRYDRDRAVASARGLRAAFDPASLAPGGAALDFTLHDKAGAVVAGAAVQVALHRPAGGGAPGAVAAAPLGGGRYRAPVGFTGPGFWDVRLDVELGGERIGLTQQVRVEAQAAAAGPCDLAAGPCTVQAGDLSITLELGRALQTMLDLPIAVEVRRGGAPLEGAAVEIAFAMKDMNMGENRVELAAAGPGRFKGQGVLVRCHSGRLDWVASVTIRPPGAAPVSAGFAFKVRE
jgi:nitrogen fixation protein FixH